MREKLREEITERVNLYVWKETFPSYPYASEKIPLNLLVQLLLEPWVGDKERTRKDYPG